MAQSPGIYINEGGGVQRSSFSLSRRADECVPTSLSSPGFDTFITDHIMNNENRHPSVWLEETKFS